MLSLAINATSTGANTVIAAVTGKLIRVTSIFLVVSADTVITFKSDTFAMSGPMSFSAKGSMVLDPTQDPDGTPHAWFTCGRSKAFVISQSGTATIAGQVFYELDDN